MHLKLILLGCKCKAVRQLSDHIMNKSEFYADLNRDFGVNGRRNQLPGDDLKYQRAVI